MGLEQRLKNLKDGETRILCKIIVSASFKFLVVCYNPEYELVRRPFVMLHHKMKYRRKLSTWVVDRIHGSSGAG